MFLVLLLRVYGRYSTVNFLWMSSFWYNYVQIRTRRPAGRDEKFDTDRAASTTPLSSVFGGDHVLVPLLLRMEGVWARMLWRFSGC